MLEKVPRRCFGLVICSRVLHLQSLVIQLLCLLSCSQSRVFEKKTNKVKQKKMWENQRMKVLFIIVGVVAVAIILGLIIYAIVSSTGQ